MADFPDTVYAEVAIVGAFAQTNDSNDLYQNDGRRTALADKVREALKTVEGLQVYQISLGGFLA